MQQHKQSYLVSQVRLVDDHSTLKPLRASGCPHAAPACPTTAQAPQDPFCTELSCTALPITGPHPWVPAQGHPPGDPEPVPSPPRSLARVTHTLGQNPWRGLWARALLPQTQGRSGLGTGQCWKWIWFHSHSSENGFPPKDSAGQAQRGGKGRKQDPAPPAAAFTPRLLDLDLLKAVQTARLRGRFTKLLPSSDESQWPAAPSALLPCLASCRSRQDISSTSAAQRHCVRSGWGARR